MKNIYAFILTILISSLSFGQVFITEIADPNNAAGARYVELYNSGPTAINLNTWALRRWTNNNASPQSDVSLSGTIPSGEFILFAANSSSFNSTFPSFTGTVIQLGGGGPADSNGDDNIALIDNTNTLVDIFGLPGEDGSSTCHEFEDGRAERIVTITSGNPTWDEAEWNVWADTTVTGCTNHTNSPQNAPVDFDPGEWIGTAASGPDNPSVFSATDVSSSQINLGYTENTALDTVVIVFNQDNVFDPPSGTPIVSNSFGDDEILFVGNGTGIFNHTALTEGTLYYYRAYSYDNTDYSSGISADAITPCNSILVSELTPFLEGFEGGVVPPSCWSSFRGTNGLGTSQDWQIETTSVNTGSNAAFVQFENVSGGDAEDWLVTPSLDLSSITDSELSFAVRDAGFVVDSDYSIRVSTTSQTDRASFSIVSTYTSFGSSYTNELVDLSAYDGQTIFIAFVMSQDNGDSWYLDDIQVSQGTSKNADIVEANFDEPDNINYSTFNAASGLDLINSVMIGEFTIQDAGSGIPNDSDALSTILESLTFNVDGADNIAALAILEEVTLGNFVNVSEVTIVSATTTFNGLSLEAQDDNLKMFRIYATFKSAVTDNEQIRLTITEAIANATGSTFAITNAGGASTSIDGDDNRIEVTATDLNFNINTSNVVVDDIMIPFPTVLAVDENGNIDLDYTETMTLTPSVSDTFSISASVVATAIAGEATFDNLSFDTVGTGYTLTVDSGTLTSDATNISNSFDVTTLVLPSGATDLFFSEYIEGSSNNKCLEIYNGTGSDVDLSLYTIQIYINGNANPSSSSDITLSGTLIDGEVYVICDDNSDAAFLAQADLTPTSNFFNGNDAVSLVKSGTRVDLIGNIGCDPASGQWFDSGTGNGTQNQTLVRNNNVCGGVTIDPTGCNGSFPALGTEWISFPEDTSSNLGSHMANCTVVIGCNTFGGNGKTSFGGVLGNGSLEICAFTGSTIDFQFTRGVNTFFTSHMIIYIDSEDDGITNTSLLTDTATSNRRAASGVVTNGNRSTITFPPGFKPDYALVVNSESAELYRLVNGAAHILIQDAGLSPINQIAASVYSFNINYTSINTTPGLEGFNFLATYYNANNSNRSNEGIGRNTSPGNVAINPIETTTYYQVNSGKQGGIARTDDPGLWNDDSTWVNGNSPLTNDEIIINHSVNVDTDFEANSINVSAGNTLTVNAINTLAIYNNSLDTNDGIFGAGSLNVNGKLLISEGGFSNIVPTYSSGSTLEYRNIAASYARFSEWTNGIATGSGVPDNVLIENASVDFTNGAQPTLEDFVIGSDLTLLTNGNLTIDPNETLSIGNNLIVANGSLDLNSNSTTYSSLLVGGSSTGDVIYKRHVNTNNSNGSVTGNNDLISAPVTNTNQIFGTFAMANPNIPSGLIGGVSSFMFGPFDNDANQYVNYNSANNNDVLITGVGYRSASTNNSTFTFTGDVQTTPVSVGINVGTGNIWNLVGNPYTSYINSGDFLTTNAGSLDENALGIYGYDGSAQNGWNIINFNTMNTAENIAPGQGFLVAAEGTSIIEFTPAMQRISGGDDFISGRTTNINQFLSLKLESASSNYHTDFYFNDNSTRALDPGYDAALFNGYLPSFYIYSHLVEDNLGKAMAIQSLASNDLSDVTIPLGIKANQGETITFSLDASTLSNSVQVFLEDNVTNTFTLLNTGNYMITPSLNLNGTGRFYLRITDNSLSSIDNSLDNLTIYSNNSDKTVVIAGQLIEATTAKIYDFQGRAVSNTLLQNANRLHVIDVTSLNAGIYVVQLVNGIQNKTQKVIIR